MIRMRFDPTKLEGDRKAEWDAWQARADKAIKQIIDVWEEWKSQPNRAASEKFEFEWKSAIWSDLKAWLKENVFNDKCAYCETPIDRFVGDAEHFRPKGRVSVKRGGILVRATTTDETGEQIQHPGYFWLAYDWQNLLPSCEACNKLQGKMDQFPVDGVHVFMRKLGAGDLANLRQKPLPSGKWLDWYYLRSEDLNDFEHPLLLHPYFDDPREHLRFGFAGIETAVDGSRRGDASIDIFRLWHDKLRKGRQIAQENAESRYMLAYGGPKALNQALQDANRAVASYVQGLEPYSAAACDWIRAKYPLCGF